VFAVAAAAAAAATATAEVDSAGEFVAFMKKYNKVYSHGEFQKRFKAFQHNLDFVANHDAAKEGFSVGINAFADLSSPSLARFTCGNCALPLPAALRRNSTARVRRTSSTGETTEPSRK